MSATDRDAGRLRSWLACAAVVTAAHLGAVAWLTNRVESPPPGTTPTATLIDLEPAPRPTNASARRATAPPPEVAPTPPEVARPDAPEEPKQTVTPPARAPAEKAESEPPSERPRPEMPAAARAPSDAVAESLEPPPVPLLKPKPSPRKVVAAEPRRGVPPEPPPDSAAGEERPDDARPRGGIAGVRRDYLVSLQAWLERHKEYPARAVRRRLEGEALLRFVMTRDGDVIAHGLARSSGSEMLDEEVLAMLERATPLPPLPPDYEAARLELVVPVRFALR